MPRLPHGMTANMMAIVNVNAIARNNGTHYGAYVAVNDTLMFAAKRKKKAKMICEQCGAEIISATGRKRRYCDECTEKRAKQQNAKCAKSRKNGEYKRQEIKRKCSVCGKEIIRHSHSSNVKCEDCKRKYKNEKVKRKSKDGVERG